MNDITEAMKKRIKGNLCTGSGGFQACSAAGPSNREKTIAKGIASQRARMLKQATGRNADVPVMRKAQWGPGVPIPPPPKGFSGGITFRDVNRKGSGAYQRGREMAQQELIASVRSGLRKNAAARLRNLAKSVQTDGRGIADTADGRKQAADAVRSVAVKYLKAQSTAASRDTRNPAKNAAIGRLRSAIDALRVKSVATNSSGDYAAMLRKRKHLIRRLKDEYGWRDLSVVNVKSR